MARALAGVLLLSACWVAAQGCGGGDPDVSSEGELRGGDDGSEVVAEVGAQVVTRADVEALLRASDLTPRQALERLVAERLLAAEAHRRGYGKRTAVRRAVREAAAHALVQREVEASEVAEDLPAEQVAPRLEQAVEDRTIPERRRVDHIVFLVKQNAPEEKQALAREGAQRALAALHGGNVDAVMDEYGAMFRYQDEVRVKAERLPPFPEQAPLAKNFVKAVFAAGAPGPLGDVVFTRYGYHAVAVREIVPPEAPPPDELEPEVRETLLVERRERRLQALLARLRKVTPVDYDAEAMLSAFGTSPRAAAP